MGDVAPDATRGSPCFPTGSSDSLHIVVHSQKGRDIGVLVSTILDIVSDANYNGLGGDCIIDQRVTRIVDLPQALSFVLPVNDHSAA